MPLTGLAKNAQSISSQDDFVTGKILILFDNFSSENVGEFPVPWNSAGSGKIATSSLAEDRWLKFTNARGITTLNRPVKLPENYTIEY